MILLAGCTPEPDALDPLREAGLAYDRGRVALDGGDGRAAAAAFAEARRADPEDRILPLWEAKALADGGDLPGAIRVLDDLLEAHPGVSEAWYNRAAYRARTGDDPGALKDLHVAVRAGVRTPFDAAQDPDFARLVGTPGADGILPGAPVLVTAKGPSGPVFLGGVVEVSLELRGVPTPIPELGVGTAASGCLRLVRVVEDDRLTAGVLTRDLRLSFEAAGPCRVELGPFEARVGAARSRSEPVTLQVDAPPGTWPEAHEVLPDPLPLPSIASPEAAAHRAVRVPAGAVALGPPDAVILGGGRSPDVVMEWRWEGQPRARGGFWREQGELQVEAEGWQETLSVGSGRPATTRAP